jgi:anaerobic selenocysteine-containing dehydrogenase
MPRIDGAGTSRFPLAESVASTFAEATLDGAQDKLRAALIYYANPLFSCADPARTRQALESIPFVVSFSPFMDDTTALADLVLPDHTYLEELQLDEPPAGTGFAALALRQPAVRPLYDTRSTGDVLIQIARAMGGPVGEAFPWPNYEKAARATLAGVAKAASMSPDKLWKTLQEEGVWSAGPYKFGDPKRTYQTPSGKFEFVSSLMKRKLEAIAGAKGTGVDGMAVDMGIAARGEKVFMPHYEKPIIDEDERFPLHLNCYKTMTHAEGRGGNQPWLQESYGVQLGEFWGPWVEINPETAHKLHIHDGEVVWLESEAGRIKVTARFFEGAMPDVVNVPFEYGHTAGGRWEARRGANPNQLSKVKHDPLCGTVSRSATRVRINRGMA